MGVDFPIPAPWSLCRGAGGRQVPVWQRDMALSSWGGGDRIEYVAYAFRTKACRIGDRAQHEPPGKARRQRPHGELPPHHEVGRHSCGPLPLIVLGAVWPNPGDKHPEGFLNAPEWSMTACVLYGLALARLQLSVSSPRSPTTHTRALAIIVLSLIPLLGVILSVILITQSVKATESMLLVTMQLLNLAFRGFLFQERSSIHLGYAAGRQSSGSASCLYRTLQPPAARLVDRWLDW